MFYRIITGEPSKRRAFAKSFSNSELVAGGTFAEPKLRQCAAHSKDVCYVGQLSDNSRCMELAHKALDLGYEVIRYQAR